MNPPSVLVPVVRADLYRLRRNATASSQCHAVMDHLRRVAPAPSAMQTRAPQPRVTEALQGLVHHWAQHAVGAAPLDTHAAQIMHAACLKGLLAMTHRKLATRPAAQA